jgi:hypothetical protein
MKSTVPLKRLNNYPAMQQLEKAFAVPDNFGGKYKTMNLL